MIEYSCQDYWSLYEADGIKGLQIEVFSDEIPNEDFSFSETSILGFYLTITFAIGAVFRTIVMYKTDRIFICDAKDPQKIRNLIAYIYSQRLEQ